LLGVKHMHTKSIAHLDLKVWKTFYVWMKIDFNI
jgi:hypothetical protein